MTKYTAMAGRFLSIALIFVSLLLGQPASAQIAAGKSKFLARTAIYQHDYFHDRYETQARANITAALAQLE